MAMLPPNQITGGILPNCLSIVGPVPSACYHLHCCNITHGLTKFCSHSVSWLYLGQSDDITVTKLTLELLMSVCSMFFKLWEISIVKFSLESLISVWLSISLIYPISLISHISWSLRNLDLLDILISQISLSLIYLDHLDLKTALQDLSILWTAFKHLGLLLSN